MTYKIHPIAELFPLMSHAELGELASDILENGMREPITLDFEGSVIDGRNRLLACERAGLEPITRTWGNPKGLSVTTFIISANLHRRHLSPSQRAMIAEKLATLSDGQTKSQVGKFAEPVLTQDEAALALRVSTRAVGSARRVRQKASPEVVAEVESGRKTVHAAERELDAPPDPPVELPEPTKLQAALGSGRHEFAAIEKKMRAIKEDIKRLAEKPWGRALGDDASQILADLRTAWNALAAAKPFAKCCYCRDGDCRACKRAGGWLSKLMFGNAPPEERGVAIKRDGEPREQWEAASMACGL